MQIVSYFILVFGVVGIGLGLYGLLVPALRQRGFSLHLPRLKLPSLPHHASSDEAATVDNLIAELERSGFRGSPFESKGPAAAGPSVVLPAVRRIEASPAAVLPQIDIDEPDPELVAILEEVVLAPAAQQEAAVAPVQPDEPVAEADAPQPMAAVSELVAGDNLMSFFDETTIESKTPEVLREAIQEINIHDLLAEARELRLLLTGAAPDRQSRA